MNKKTKFITDYISSKKIHDTPEEREAVQIFSKRLVEEYGYNKLQIQTRPQFKVKESPSGKEKYPVDIAVFQDNKKIYSNLSMIVECKRKIRQDGIKQLKIYMSLSSAQIGIWFNGSDHAYLQKFLDDEGNVTYQTLPEIPKKGQSIRDIGKHKRQDLQPPKNLKSVFKDIRNHLVGMTTGITRDEALAQEIINILFCKIWDELYTNPNDMVTVRAGIDDTVTDVKQRISNLFSNKVKKEYSDVFAESDIISLDDNSLFYVVSSLQNYCITEADRDAIGEAFEVFIGPALRGGEGQFFTPRNAVRMIVDILDPDTNELVIDPACGSGGFLIVVLEKIWKKIDEDGKKKKWTSETIAFKKKELASKLLFGIDKDAFLAKVTKAYMALMGDGRGGVFCENALQPIEKWNTKTQDTIELDKFNIIITNPPFGSKIKVEGETILSQFNLANTWKRDKTSKIWTMQSKMEKKQPPQILFIERCLQLLKDGGRLGMMLPESLFANPSHGYIVEFLKKHGEITGLISLPDELFQPYTHAKTCVLFFKKTESKKEDYPIFMGIADYCGHDSRGNKIPFDDIPKIQQQYIKVKTRKNTKHDSIGFIKKSSELKNNIVIPKYYNPLIIAELNRMKKTHNLVSIKELVDNNTLVLSTGVEIGKMSYGTGKIPFIRTSDISNWEIKIDPKHGVNEDIYSEYVTKCDLQENDILLVRDGTYLIGTCALITKNDLKSLFQSHIYKIRVLNKKKLSPFLLLALLASPIVQKQIRAKQFTQDIIDTLGSRLNELILPIPKDSKFTKTITIQTKNIIQKRTELRKIASEIPIKIQKGPQ